MYQLNRLQAPLTKTVEKASSELTHLSKSSSGAEHEIGTMMWIGDRLSAQACDVYRYCEANAPQLAYRASMEDAIERPSTGVGQIVIHRSDRRASFDNELYQLARAYPKATLLEMFGSMWEGHVYRRDISLATQQFYWHRWNQVLPQMFGCRFPERSSATPNLPTKSVAIIASSFADADPLMDLATSAGAASVWYRSAQVMTARNCSVVWWDDSAANAATEMVWRERMEAVEKHSSVRPQHVWLATAPRAHQCFRARNAGIDVVFSKPYRIESLMSTLVGYRTDLGARTSLITHAGNRSSATSHAEIAKIRIAA